MKGRLKAIRRVAAGAVLALAVAILSVTAAVVTAQEPSAPSAPASVTVTRGYGALTATWPAVDGATSYHVSYQKVGDPWLTAAPNHTSTSITISDQVHSFLFSYVVRVQARNDHGDSPWTRSAPTGVYVPPLLPDPPASVTVSRDDGTLIVSWAAAFGADSYNVNTSDDGRRSWVRAQSDVTGTSTTIPNVQNSSTYIVAVQGVNDAGRGNWTDSAAVGPYTPPTPTPTPTATPTPTPTPAPTPETAEAQAEAEAEDGASIASDNDTDDDNLIEVTSVAQFIAMQWDLNGDGTPESETTKYNTAFDSGVSGCSSTCAGYEITADLTITANPTDAGTTYLIPGTWNTTFQGNGNTITNNDSRPLFENIGATTGSTTGEIKGLNVDNSSATDAILANKVQAQGKVTNTGVTGSVTVSDNGTRGGLVNELNGGIISGSHSHADVSVTGGDAPPATQYQYSVGGLVGYVASGQVLSSHASGAVSYTKSGGGYWDGRARRYVGGLVGRNAGTIYAAFAWGSVQGTDNYRSINDATLGRTRTVTGGLIGRVESGGVVRSGYATGAVSVATSAPTRPHNEFGASIAESVGTVNYVYGSGTVSPGDGSNNNPTGTSAQTESALKSPTGYTGIYANWNFDIDNADDDDDLTTGTDDPWHFGTSSQLPVFDYTPQGGTPLPPADLQPASLTLTATSTTIAEGDTTTITASLASAKGYAVRVTQPDNESRYTYDITIAKGGTSATGTFTSVENTSENYDISVALTASRTYPSGSVDIVSTSSTITIQEDEIRTVSGLTATQAKQTDNTYDITVTWDAPGTENTRNATAGYDFEYRISTDTTWTTETISTLSTVTKTIENATASKTYQVRIRAKSSSSPRGLCHRLHRRGRRLRRRQRRPLGNHHAGPAQRHPLGPDGNGTRLKQPDRLRRRLPQRPPRYGLRLHGCNGYELSNDLDFDTGTKGDRTDDTYYNSGSGWTTIGNAGSNA